MKHILKEIYWIVLSAVSLLFFSCSDKWDGGTNKPLVPGQYAVVAKTRGFGQETSATDSIENILYNYVDLKEEKYEKTK